MDLLRHNVPDVPTAVHTVPYENQKKLCYKTIIRAISFVFTHYSIILKHVLIYILSVLIMLSQHSVRIKMKITLFFFFCKRTTLYSHK